MPVCVPALVKEFNSIHVINLRGHTCERTSGERATSGGWASIRPRISCNQWVIVILVRNPNAAHNGCRILYRDIGDYLKREEKLQILRDAGSTCGY